MGLHRHVEEGSKPDDIVAPKNRFQLSEIGFIQVGAFIDRAVVHSADLKGQGVRLRSNQQVSAQAAELARQAVAHVESHHQASGGDGHTCSERRRGEQFAVRIADEGLSHQAGKHFLWMNQRSGVGECGKVHYHFASLDA